jgi:uncharacterized membrane protein YqjE
MSSNDRSISSVLQDIVGNVQDIVRGEVRLAKTELREELVKAKSAAILMAVGAVAAIFAVLFILLAIASALDKVMPEWAATLCVAVGIGIVASIAISTALKRFRTINAVPKTAASMKENVEWAKQLTK